MHSSVIKKLLNRPKDSNKYDFGHLLVIGGSPGMVGAPLLTGMAALRVGAGLVTIASAPNVIDKLERRVLEIMTLVLPDNKAEIILGKFIRERKLSVIVIGPGMQPKFAEKIIGLIKNTDFPIIIDGGGLAALQNKPALLKHSAKVNLILTPHMGEFQRFFSQTLPKDKEKLHELAADFARSNNVILVLKGHPTFVFNKNGDTYKNETGGPELASAGTGDILAGLIGGIIAQGIDPLSAAITGVYLHGKAGSVAAKSKSVPSVIASDVIEAIPAALKFAELT